MLKLYVNRKNVTAYAGKITCSGALDSCARQLSVEWPKNVIGAAGEKVELYVDGQHFFSGYVVLSDADGMEAMTPGMYFMRNKIVGEYTGTPQELAALFCAAQGATVLSVPELPQQVTVSSTGDKSYYQVLDEAFNGQDNKKRVKDWAILFQGRELVVFSTKGLSDIGLDATIIDGSHRSSIKNMVNHVIILDDNNALTGVAENMDDRLAYGTFTEVYKQQADKDAATEAAKLLQGVEVGGKISALGNVRCIAGVMVYAKHRNARLKGMYIIKSDTHTFQAGNHDMNLEVEYYEPGV